jgi:hypothetical protein
MLALTAMSWLRRILIALCLLMLGPLAMAAGGKAQLAADWRSASRESAGLAPAPESTPEAVVQVYAARAYAWRGIFAVHSWISVKPEGARSYTTYEVVGWRAFRGGDAVQVHNGGPDRYWFGSKPELLAELRGADAAEAIRDIGKAVADYPWPNSYRTWPGPNSNTFVAFVSRRVPALRVDLPPTAIGKDYLGETTFVGRTPSGGGLQLSLWGALGVLVSAEEGLEFNLLGLSFGVDPADFAIRLPGIGLVKP